MQQIWLVYKNKKMQGTLTRSHLKIKSEHSSGDSSTGEYLPRNFSHYTCVMERLYIRFSSTGVGGERRCWQQGAGRGLVRWPETRQDNLGHKVRRHDGYMWTCVEYGSMHVWCMWKKNGHTQISNHIKWMTGLRADSLLHVILLC